MVGGSVVEVDVVEVDVVEVDVVVVVEQETVDVITPLVLHRYQSVPLE